MLAAAREGMHAGFDWPETSAYARRSARRRTERPAGKRREAMANLALVYGMRLFPAEELSEVMEATVKLKNGRTARITMHLIEGTKQEIEKTLRRSIEAFFEMYPEI